MRQNPSKHAARAPNSILNAKFRIEEHFLAVKINTVLLSLN